MGEALFELEQVLRSKQEKLTSQEINVLMTCKGKAIRDFTVGACVGGGLTWLGAAALSGFWRFGHSLDSCIEQILGMDGSRMQMELANIMLKKYRDDPLTTRLISKHFYSERVFDETSSDQLKLRWRYRNSSGDNVAHSARTQESDSCGDQTNPEKTDVELKHVSTNIGDDSISNPFDCVFGAPPRVDNIHRSGLSSTSPKRHSRNHKRSHRRHRMRNQEVPSNYQPT